MRSYEEQWTEEEFEKMCQADSPESPKLKEEVIEKNSPVVASGSIIVAAKPEPPAPVPIVSPQPSLEQPIQQSKEVTPPSRRGRGRPKRATAELSQSAVVNPAPPGAIRPDIASQCGTVSSFPTASASYSLPSSANVNAVTGTIHQFGVWIAPSSQSTPSLSPVPPGVQSAPTASPAPTPAPSLVMQVKGQARKTRGGAEAPRRRGKKQAVVPPTVPVPLAPSGDGKTDMISQMETVSSFPTASCPDSVSGSTATKGISNEQGLISTAVPVLPSFSEIGKMDSGSEVQPISSNPMVPGPDSFPATYVVTGVMGTMEHFSSGIAPSSQPNPSFTSDAQSIPPSVSAPQQLKGRGRKPQSGAEAPRRRGRKPGPVAPVAADGLSGQVPKLIEQPESKVQVSSGRKFIGTRRKRENEATQVMNVVQVQASEISISDSLSHLDSKPTRHSDNSAQNKDQKGLSTSSESAAKSTSMSENQNEKVDVKAHVMKDHGLAETFISETKVVEIMRLEEKKHVSKMETVATAVDPKILKTEDVSPETQHRDDPMLQLETKPVAGSFKSVENSRDLVDQNLLMGTNLEGASVVALNADPCGKPTFCDASVLNLTVDKDQYGKEDAKERELKCSVLDDVVVSGPGENTLSTLEKASSPVVLETEITKEGVDSEPQESSDHILHDAVLEPEAHELESNLNTGSLGNVAENSMGGTNVDVTSYISPNGENSNEPCRKSPAPGSSVLETAASGLELATDKYENQYGKENVNELEMKSLVVNGEVFLKSGVADKSLEKSTLSCMETGASVVTSESQKTQIEVGTGLQGSNDPVLQETDVSTPEVCELETQIDAGGFENLDYSKELAAENLTLGTNAGGTSDVPPNADSSDNVPHEKPPSDVSVFDCEMEMCVDHGREVSKEQKTEGPLRNKVSVPELEMAETKILEHSTRTSLSTLEEAAPGFCREIEKKVKEVNAVVGEANVHILKEPFILDPETYEPETKLEAQPFENATDPRDSAVKNSIEGTNVDDSSAFPLSGEPSENVVCEKHPPDVSFMGMTSSILDLATDKHVDIVKDDAEGCKMRNFVINKAVVPEVRVAESTSLEEHEFYLSKFNNAAPVVDPEIEKKEKENKAEQGSNDPTLQEPLVSVPQACIPETPLQVGSLDNVADQREVVKEHLMVETIVDSTSTVHLTAEPSENLPCEKPAVSDGSVVETEASVLDPTIVKHEDHWKDDTKGQEMRGPPVDEAGGPDLGVAEARSLEKEKLSTSPTLEIAAPVFYPEIVKMDVNTKAQESNDHILQEVVPLKPEACETETNLEPEVHTPDAAVPETAGAILDLAVDRCEDKPEEGDTKELERKDTVLGAGIPVVTENQSSEETSSTLETSCPVTDAGHKIPETEDSILDLQMDKRVDQCGKEGTREQGRNHADLDEGPPAVTEKLSLEERTAILGAASSVTDSPHEIPETEPPILDLRVDEHEEQSRKDTKELERKDIVVDEETVSVVTEKQCMEVRTSSDLEAPAPIIDPPHEMPETAATASVLDLTFDKCEDQSQKEGEKEQQINDTILDGGLVSEPLPVVAESQNLERNLETVSPAIVDPAARKMPEIQQLTAGSSEMIEENPIMGTNMEGTPAALLMNSIPNIDVAHDKLASDVSHSSSLGGSSHQMDSPLAACGGKDTLSAVENEGTN